MMKLPLATKRPRRQEIGQVMSVAAPIKGWNTRDPLANMDSRYAITLDNWLPGTGSVDVRPGMTAWETGIPAIVESLLAWKGPASEKLFAFTSAGVYDVTAGGVAGASVQARTSGYSCGVNFTTTGGAFLVTVNGVDDLAYTNGTTWTTIASFAITGGGSINTNQLQNVNSFKRSLYFIPKNSMSFFYLPIDSITGTVSEYPLGGLFPKGGSLVAMGTWTIDGGFGSEDYSMFITSEGQAAVYLGTNPDSVSTWTLKGIYDLSPPLGLKCFCKFGGDLLVLTRRGLVSMTKILQDTRLSPSASLSDVIGEAFSVAMASTGEQRGWEVIEFPDKNCLVCNVPQAEFSFSHQYVMNTKTGAWCRFKGWDGFTFCFFNAKLYMGMVARVTQVFTPGNDLDASITAEAKTAYSYYSPRSRIKSWKLLRANLNIGGTISVNLALDTDFAKDGTFGAAVFNVTELSRWDSALWDASVWSMEPGPRNEWVTVAAPDSYCAATRLRVIARDATIQWSATDTLFEPGALV